MDKKSLTQNIRCNRLLPAELFTRDKRLSIENNSLQLKYEQQKTGSKVVNISYEFYKNYA